MTQIIYLILANLISSTSIGIVLVVVSWMLVASSNEQILIYLSIASLALLVILRKRIYGLLNVMAARHVMAANAFIIALILCSLIVFPGTLSLGISMFFAQIYIYFYYLSRAILVKQLVSDDKYGRYNGILEIENQVSALVAGGVAAYLIGLDVVSFEEVLIFAIVAMFLAGVIVAAKIRVQPDQSADSEDTENLPIPGLKLLLLVLAASSTFICVKLLDVINPIHIVKVLNESADVIAISGIFYTIGAIVAGFMAAVQVTKHHERKFIALCISGFAAFCVVATMYPDLEVFYLSWLAWGFFNALSRVCWQTIAMNELSEKRMSRFFAQVSILVDVSRTVLLFVYSVLIIYLGNSLSFPYLALICGVGAILFVASQAGTIRRSTTGS